MNKYLLLTLSFAIGLGGIKFLQSYDIHEKEPLWNWGAFIIPEFWFLWHEIWGACSLVLQTEGILLYTLMPYLGFKHSVLITLVAIRLAAALLGHRIYYYRNGRWAS